MRHEAAAAKTQSITTQRKCTCGQMGASLNHAPGVAGRMYAAALAAAGDENEVSALSAPGTGKAMGKDATMEDAERFALGAGRHRTADASSRLSSS